MLLASVCLRTGVPARLLAFSAVQHIAGSHAVLSPTAPGHSTLQWCERPRQKDKTGLRSKPLEDLQASLCGGLFVCLHLVVAAAVLVQTHESGITLACSLCRSCA